VQDEAPLRDSQRGAVRWITIDRADKRNAMTSAMARRLGELLTAADEDDETRVVVLTGSGSSFSAGLDLAEIAQGLEKRSEFPVEQLVEFRKPTIALVNGLAFGGGATMAMACDLRVAVASATLTFGLGRVGLTPEFGSTYLLWRQIGWSRALDVYLTGRTIEAEEALRLGLVDRVEDDDVAPDATQRLAEQIAALPAGTAEATKQVLRRGLDVGFREARDIEKRMLTERSRAMRAARAAKAARAGDLPPG
jgi:enoyl-CoA hydratase/carnithine racemase